MSSIGLWRYTACLTALPQELF